MGILGPMSVGVAIPLERGGYHRSHVQGEEGGEGEQGGETYLRLHVMLPTPSL